MRAEGGERCEADSRLTARTENVTYSIFIAHIYVVLPVLYDQSGPVLLSVSAVKGIRPVFIVYHTMLMLLPWSDCLLSWRSAWILKKNSTTDVQFIHEQLCTLSLTVLSAVTECGVSVF